MEEGSLRCDVNVSVSTDPDAFGERTEIKNLNSLRHIADSIGNAPPDLVFVRPNEGSLDFEIKRQTGILLAGNAISRQTLGYNIPQRKTYPLRDKELLADYRYLLLLLSVFPEHS